MRYALQDIDLLLILFYPVIAECDILWRQVSATADAKRNVWDSSARTQGTGDLTTFRVCLNIISIFIGFSMLLMAPYFEGERIPDQEFQRQHNLRIITVNVVVLFCGAAAATLGKYDFYTQ